MRSMKNLFARAAFRDDTYFPPPASSEEIRAFEAGNNITLPVAFREWLELSDGGASWQENYPRTIRGSK